MTLTFHPEANEELFAAIDWYEEQEPGLGEQFILEALATLNRIQEYPEAWPFLSGDVRRCLTNKFPFAILYAHFGDTILILAVMHLSREPGYWKDRLG